MCARVCVPASGAVCRLTHYQCTFLMRLSPLRCAELTHTTSRVSHSPPGRRSGGRGLAEPPPAPALSASPCRAAHTGSRAVVLLKCHFSRWEGRVTGSETADALPGRATRAGGKQTSGRRRPTQKPRGPPGAGSGARPGPREGRTTDRQTNDKEQTRWRGAGLTVPSRTFRTPRNVVHDCSLPTRHPSGQGRPRLPGPDISCSAGLALALSRCAGGRGHGESGVEGPRPALASPHPWSARTPPLDTPGGSSV